MSMFFSSDSWKRGVRAAAGARSLLLVVSLCLGLTYPALAAERKPTAARPKPTAAGRKATAPRLSLSEVVKRHVSARGGLQAWRAVQALSLKGKMDAGTGDSVARSVRAARARAGTQEIRREIAAGAHTAEPERQVQLPFTLAKQRPNKSRLEIEFAGKTAVQVYDGTNGWKVRPYLNRNDVEPFTPQEAKVEAQNADVVDPLIDYAAKGTKVELVGVEQVEGNDAYKLKLTTKAGAVQHVWIDARSFLDVKVEGVPRRMDGKMHTVWVYQRDFRSVQGLKIPFVLETVVEGYPQAHKIQVEKVVVNPKLDAATFAKPT
jgi:outer membrane lipoprotein-sorting protein